MKTTGVSSIPKFGLLDFLGHPSVKVSFKAQVESANFPSHFNCVRPGRRTGVELELALPLGRLDSVTMIHIA